MHPDLLELYMFIHYNARYDWLRPTIEEIVAAYKAAYGSSARESDVESDEVSGTDEETDEGESDTPLDEDE